MFDLSIVIGDFDVAYSQKLLNYLMFSKQINFSVHAFSNANDLNNFLKTNSTNVLLITEEMYSLVDINMIEVCLLLVDNVIDSNNLGMGHVYKYQRACKIQEAIIKQYCSYTKKELINFQEKNKKFIGVYSPIGGSGKSTVALGLAKIYAKLNYKTLLLSFEEVSSLGGEGNYSLSDLIYYLKRKNSNINIKLEMIAEVDADSDLSYIPPAYHPEDIESFKDDEIKYFIDYLKTYGWYDRVIIDLSSSYSFKNKGVLKAVDQVVLVNNQLINQQNKLNKWLNSNCMSESILNKSYIIQNNNLSGIQLKENSTINQSIKEMVEIIPYNKEIMKNSNNGINMCINNEFENVLKNMVKLLDE